MNIRNKVEEKWLVLKENIAKRQVEIERSKAGLKVKIITLKETWKKELLHKFDSYFCSVMETLEKIFSRFQSVQEDEIKLHQFVEEEPLLVNENGVQ